MRWAENLIYASWRSLACLQQAVIRPWPARNFYQVHSFTSKLLWYMSISSFQTCLDLPRIFFPTCYRTKHVFTVLSFLCVLHVTTVNLILLHLIKQTYYLNSKTLKLINLWLSFHLRNLHLKCTQCIWSYQKTITWVT